MMKSGWGVLTPLTPVGSCGNMMHTCSDSAGLGRETAEEAAIKARGGREAQGLTLMPIDPCLICTWVNAFSR